MLRWCGFDFGETIMNPFTLHQSQTIAAVFRELGREAEAPEVIKRWYALRDSYGAEGDTAEQRVRQLKQYAKDRIYSEVLGNDKDAGRLFDQKEAEGFTPTDGVETILKRLSASGVEVSVVSESSSASATQAISRFLSAHRLDDLFDQVITPAGLFEVGGALTDSRFVGATKRSGSMYDVLRLYLLGRGLASGETAMVGDDPVLDIENAKLRGFLGIQYTGVVDRGKSRLADYVISHWRQFPAIF